LEAASAAKDINRWVNLLSDHPVVVESKLGAKSGNSFINFKIGTLNRNLKRFTSNFLSCVLGGRQLEDWSCRGLDCMIGLGQALQPDTQFQLDTHRAGAHHEIRIF
jgi:hypothetical protein